MSDRVRYLNREDLPEPVSNLSPLEVILGALVWIGAWVAGLVMIGVVAAVSWSILEWSWSLVR